MEKSRGPDTDLPAIDALGSEEALAAMVASHLAAVEGIKAALPALSAAAELVANTLRDGGTLHYAAAGSSGLMAFADACELPGTFGVPKEQINVSMAGGIPATWHLPGGVEDDTLAATGAAESCKPGDVVLAMSASGATPYAVAFARAAQRRGVTVIAIANRGDSALAQSADLVVEVPTEREVVDGSTRLGAGTAQKVILNMISTQAGILLGHVHDGLMINFTPDNAKLRARAIQVVATIAGVPEAQAETSLDLAQGDIKPAILVAKGAGIDEARAVLKAHRGHLRDCLCAIDKNNATMG